MYVNDRLKHLIFWIRYIPLTADNCQKPASSLLKMYMIGQERSAYEDIAEKIIH
jgi:hypothetical protein